MSRRAGKGPTAYARAIERLWSRLTERAIVLSPREWSLISDWHARGIPLELIAECLEASLAKRRRSGPPRSLGYVSPAVEEAWSAVVAGRLRTDAEEAPPARPAETAAFAWRRRLEQLPAGSPLAALIASLLERLARGDPEATLDGALDDALADAVDPERRRAAEAAVLDQLAAFRSRMPPETYESTVRRALVNRLRCELELPRLARRERC